jgi:nucleoside-diphosphate-sugar epimerase
MEPLKILVIGANGQIGTELARGAGRAPRPAGRGHQRPGAGGPRAGLRHEALDVTDAGALTEIVKRHGITQIYLLAAALSASGEQHPQWAWDLNMKAC